MKRSGLIIFCLAAIMGCEDGNESNYDMTSCDSSSVQPICLAPDMYQACVLGQWSVVFCGEQEKCEDGRCVPDVRDGLNECDSSYVKHCENNMLYSCENGKIYSVDCPGGCKDGVCISSSVLNPTPDDPTPNNSTPNNPTPDSPTPSNPTPDNPTPDNPTPDNPTPDNPTPDNPTPDNPTPDNPTPDNPTPDNPTPDNPQPVPECNAGYIKHCEGSVALSCVEEKIVRKNCTNGCENGDCKVDSTEDPVGPKTDCDEAYVTHCENNVLLSCVGGTVDRKECMYGCYGTACLPDQVQPPIPDECDDLYKIHCEGDVLVWCSGGEISYLACQFGCMDNACRGDEPIDEKECGNYRIDEGEVCDGTNIGDATCHDVIGSDPKAGYSGEPACNNTCTALTWGTCQTSTCGNGWIEPEYGEICESGEDYVDFVGRDYTCEDYLPGDYLWQPGGYPGCSSDCKGLSKGTCKLAPQPIGDLEQCQFDSLAMDKESGLAVALATVTVSPGVEGDLVAGRLVCTLHIDGDDSKTYTWSLKSEAEKTLCSYCGMDEYQLISEINTTSWPGGIYDCAFLVNAQGGMNSYYMCSTILGYPVPQEDVPDASQIRNLTVDEEQIEGTVLAHWSFAAYHKGDMATSVVADDGVLASQSVMTLSTGDIISMLSGPSGNPEAAASSNDWPVTSTLDYGYKHFLFSVSTVGYGNIRFKFKVAGSGINVKRVQLAYKLGDFVNVVGDEFVFNAKNEYQIFPLTSLPGADNQNYFEIRVYAYGETFEENTTVRIDDIYVIGDPM